MPLLSKPIRLLLFAILVVVALYFARDFLIPICFAGLLAMLFLSVCRWLEGKGMGRGLAAFLCLVSFILVIAGVVWLLQWQLSGLLKDVAGIEQRITQQVNKIRQFITNTLGLSQQKQQELLKQQSSGGSGMLNGIMSIVSDTFIKIILVLVYTFLFLYFRGHIKKFILKVSPVDEHRNVLTIIDDSTKVAQHYLTGMAMMIGTLWILYSIGFSLVGVKSPVFFAILCGLLEIIPFVGNLTGTALTVLFSLTQGGSTNIVISILIVYGLIQFIQSYILEPLIVGAKVHINPLFTIIGLVAGELLWGIPGIILAIPLLAIVKIICDHIPSLQPYGFLIGEIRKKKEGGFTDKIKKMFKKK